MKFACEKCGLDFDENTFAPRVITNCGHTICTLCLKGLLKIQLSESEKNFQQTANSQELASQFTSQSMFGNNVVRQNPNPNPNSLFSTQTVQIVMFGSSSTTLHWNCPICNIEITNQIPYEEKDKISALKHFPINDALLKCMKAQKEQDEFLRRAREPQPCAEHGWSKSITCFSPDCKNKALACFRCVQTLHRDCQSQLMADWMLAKERVKFMDYSVKFDDIKKSLENFKSQLIDQISSKVTEMIESTIAQIRDNMVSLDFSVIDSFEKNLDFLTSSIETNDSGVFIAIRPVNKTSVDRHLVLDQLENIFQKINSQDYMDFLRKELDEVIAATTKKK